MAQVQLVTHFHRGNQVKSIHRKILIAYWANQTSGDIITHHNVVINPHFSEIFSIGEKIKS